MDWMILTLIAIPIVALIILTVRALRRPSRMPDRRPNPYPDPADRMHKQATDYRASGALPRWDP